LEWFGEDLRPKCRSAAFCLYWGSFLNLGLDLLRSLSDQAIFAWFTSLRDKNNKLNLTPNESNYQQIKLGEDKNSRTEPLEPKQRTIKESPKRHPSW